jgi:hypothetical protein
MVWVRKKPITESDIEREKLKMAIEKALRGKVLIVGNGESEAFWQLMKELSR